MEIMPSNPTNTPFRLQSQDRSLPCIADSCRHVAVVCSHQEE